MSDQIERRYIGNFDKSEKSDPSLLRVERRAAAPGEKPKTYIVGYAAVFDKNSLMLGDFYERIDPDAFELVEERTDGNGLPLETRCLFNHDPNHLLGRFPTTMRLTIDEKGLKYECLLPESRADIAESIERGDLKGSSFSFIVADEPGSEQWTTERGESVRIVRKIKSLPDCGPVTYPAYADSSVAVAKRSYDKYMSEQRAFCPTGKGGGGVFIYEPKKKSSRSDRLLQLEKRAIELRDQIKAETRNDCGRDESGKFGSGNKCQDEGEAPSKFEPKKAIGGNVPSGRLGKPKGEYMQVAPDDVKAKIGEMQAFADRAREKMKDVGKDNGAKDDGGGVQTWSKGDHHPWTIAQKGDSSTGGYAQGKHPDGSKTKKYPFKKGEDGSAAHKAVEEELKAKKKDKRSYDELMRFYRARAK